MKYPKKVKTIFVQFAKYDCRQINVHKGSKFLYWFIQPYEKPYTSLIGNLPNILNADLLDETLKKLDGFHL